MDERAALDLMFAAISELTLEGEMHNYARCMALLWRYTPHREATQALERKLEQEFPEVCEAHRRRVIDEVLMK